MLSYLGARIGVLDLQKRGVDPELIEEFTIRGIRLAFYEEPDKGQAIDYVVGLESCGVPLSPSEPLLIDWEKVPALFVNMFPESLV